LAATVGTFVIEEAGIPIRTSRTIRRRGTPCLRIATIVRARVVIVASKHVAGHAPAILALGTWRAGIAIIARLGVRRKGAVAARTGVVRARVSIVAPDGRAANTLAVLTTVVGRTRITIAARSRRSR
jgi:hypothetical protein